MPCSGVHKQVINTSCNGFQLQSRLNPVCQKASSGTQPLRTSPRFSGSRENRPVSASASETVQPLDSPSSPPVASNAVREIEKGNGVLEGMFTLATCPQPSPPCLIVARKCLT